MTKREYDFIIVGLGLAGATLSHHLIKKGKSVYAFDNNEQGSSSRVAAGLYNPITGRKMIKTWKADLLFPYLINYYKEIAKETQIDFFKEKEIYRPFITTEEQNEWSARSADEAYIPYIKQVHYASRNIGAKDHFGGIELKQTGYLKVREFLNAVTTELRSRNNFTMDTSSFDENQIQIFDDRVEIGGIVASKIIFCSGVNCKNSIFFNWLPFTPVKGEILEFESDLPNDVIINRGVFVIPYKKNRFKVGSTYDNNDLTTEPTLKGKTIIEEKLNELISVNYKTLNHYAGVRPATKDRKPFVGIHPKYKNVGIFNGLGTKGVSLAPYFANQFTQYLVNQSALDKEVNIERFYPNFTE